MIARRPVSAATNLPCPLVGVLALALVACGPPVGVRHVSPQRAAEDLTRSALNSDRPSLFSENVLYRWNLTERFEDDPEGTLAILREKTLAEPGTRHGAFALAELSFKHAEDARARRREYYLAAAVYAFGFLFPMPGAAPLDPLDPRARIAADIYNRGLTQAFASPDGDHVELRPGVYPMPFGQQLDLRLDPAELRWAGHDLYQFTPVAEMEVRGIGMRYRRPGLGAPLAAGFRPDGPAAMGGYLNRNAKAPVTAVVLIDDPRTQLAGSNVVARMHVFNAYDRSAVTIDGQEVPLEVEPTAALAYQLSTARIWRWELRGFLVGDLLGQETIDRPLGFVQPYRAGRIPVVFVHGTASSPGRWVNMLNVLENTPALRDRFQYWFFFYETNNPIPYSAMKLRDTLTEAVHRLDPAGTDVALQNMVLVGHSQGGLLTKLAVVEPGDQLWQQFSSKPIDRLNVSSETRELLRDTLLFAPLPFVREVIFISTPHRGSYVAGWTVAQWVSRFARLPRTLVGVTTDFLTGDPGAVFINPERPAIGAVYGMTPGSPLLKTLAPMPIVPGVQAHSIIPIKGNLPPDGQNDGVVKYDSAHLDGVASELVIERQGHSAQDNPLAIEEVRRILAAHADAVCAASGVACAVGESAPTPTASAPPGRARPPRRPVRARR